MALTLVVIYAGYGVWSWRRNADFWNKALPYFALAGVGIGSAAFHGSMKLQAQWCKLHLLTLTTEAVIPFLLSCRQLLYSESHLLTISVADDLAMFFATGIILYRVMSFGKSSAWSRNFGITLFALLVSIAVYHCSAVETIAHQSTFVVMVFAVATRTRSLINNRVSNVTLKKRMKDLARLGAGMSSFPLTTHSYDRYNLC